MSNLEGLELIRSFFVVAEELNFRRSAERLHLDQSALTRRIQKLEHALGFTLFERTTREVVLTQAGRAFYNDNKRLLGEYDRSVEAARSISTGHSGMLTVAYMTFAAVELMPRAVAAYRQSRPHVALRLRYVRTQGQKILLANGEIDVGFLLGPIEHSDFESLTVNNEKLCVVARQEHPLLQLPAILPEHLAEQAVVLGDTSEWEFYRWRLDDLFGQKGIVLDVQFQASTSIAILGLVRAGLGVTILPECLVPALHSDLEAREIEREGFSIETCLAWRRDSKLKTVRDFVDIVASAQFDQRR